jgi:hypothetical protein
VVAYASSISTPLPCPSDDDRSLSEFNFSLINGRGVRAKLVTINFFVVYMGPGHGFINQTKEFTDGYVLGFCSVAGSDASMDEDEATFWCSDGPSRYKAISHTE